MRMAVVESMLFLLRRNLAVMQTQRAGGEPIRHITLSGGLSQSDAFCQAVCDVTGLAVSRTDESETTARGIARLAANLPTWPDPMWTHFTTDGTQQRHARYARCMANMPEPQTHV
jgi:sugar (pentulose or hexulose) kinase